MKRIIFALLLLPQLVYAQYRADCFNLDSSDDASQMKIGNTYTQDTTLTFDVRSKISGLSISGTATLNNDNDSYIRVTLVDDYNYEFLVYENYPALSDDMTSKFSNIALETILLDGITPKSLKIHLLNASLKLDAVNYVNEIANRKQNPDSYASIQKVQVQYIVDKLNANLKKKNMTWRAGVTSMSEKTFSEKKDMFGGTVPELYGFEHYIGGIFVMPGEYLNSPSSRTSNQYVTEWDWRYRHGKNWMTPVNYHNNCGACWAFASISAIEAYANLYYNNLINLDLSEEEIISCISQNGCSGGTEFSAFNYIKNYGVVSESCFPFEDSVLDCTLKCDNPDERIFIQGHRYIPINEDSVKHHLMKCPLTIAIGEWGHSMALVGYKTIEIGDKIYFGNYLGNNSSPDYVVINSSDHQNIIGRTAWLMKNSWQPWGDNGYLYVMVDMLYPKVWRVQSVTGEITSLNYDDSYIVCEDADGDGYYFWGLGPKPASISGDPDGDDSDPNYGTMDDFGNLTSLTSDLYLYGSYVYNRDLKMHRNIIVPNGSILRIKGNMTLCDYKQISVYGGGTLIVDGGAINDAIINLYNGSTLTVLNNGIINMQQNQVLVAPVGAIVNISEGQVNNC